MLTERDIEVLNELSGRDWCRPMDLGGRDASHHSATLRKLVKLGLAEQKIRAGWHKSSYLYRPSPAGEAKLKEIHAAHPSG